MDSEELVGGRLGTRSGDLFFRMALLPLLIGMISGVTALVFRWLLALLQSFFFGTVAQLLSNLGPYRQAPLPLLGALVGGILVSALAHEARGAGVSSVVVAVRDGGSRIRGRVALVKVLVTSLIIGSGGSGGIEGPALQIGSGLGSKVGQMARQSEESTRICLASGAAAAVAATFNTPMAGLLLAHEVILGGVSWSSLIPVALSAAVGDGVARLAFGGDPLLGSRAFGLQHPAELLLYLLVAILAAGVGVAFTHGFDRVETAFTHWSLPGYLKPAAGGLAVGLIGLAFPQVMGLGYDILGAALDGSFPVFLLAALVVVKPMATSLTVGSGAAGGLIGPSLFTGAVLGGAAGGLFHTISPGIAGPAGGYVLAGMGALLAATFHAPLAAAVIPFELTADYTLLPVFLLTSTLSGYLARRISPHTIYSIALSRQGIQ